MANELVHAFSASQIMPLSGGYGLQGHAAPYGYKLSSLGKGLLLTKDVSVGGLVLFRVPEATGLATGLTVSFVLADDPDAPAAGLKPYMGITIAPLTDATYTLDDGSAGPLASATEALAQITMPSTSGFAKVGSIAVVNASMNSLAAGNWSVMRIRRRGTHASDTHTGRVILLGGQIRNT